MDTQEKIKEEIEVLKGELDGLGLFDPETKTWNAVAPRESGEETESDDNDLADRFEDFDERSAKIAVLFARLKNLEDKLQ